MQRGDAFGRYEILGLLGKGAMGQVFRAYDQVLHRQVALKLLGDPEPATGSQASTPGVQSILREARNAAALTHPNVVALYDVGEQQGRPFLVMELVSGRSLRSHVGADAGVASRLRWLVDVARALSAAHRIGLVHRDIKPENVLVSDEGVAKVLDFGIARRFEVPVDPADRRAFADCQRPITQGNSLLAGTPGYMAPELLTGRQADSRVDQFAWGVMAYELLSGRSPWGDQPEHMMQALLHEEPPALDAVAPGVEAAIAGVVARAMRKAPAARFPTMDALIAAMEGSRGEVTASGQDDLATVSGMTQTLDTGRARVRLGWVVVAAALAAATVGGALFVFRPSTTPASSSVSLQRSESTAAPSGAPSAADPSPSVSTPEAAAAPAATTPAASEARPLRPSPRPPPGRPLGSGNGSIGNSAPSSAVASTTATPPSRLAASCDPPFTLDAGGRKHFKPECYLTP